MPRIEQSDTIRTYQSGSISFACIEDLLFQNSTFVGFFTKACRQNDECSDLFFFSQCFDCLGTEFCRNDQNGKVGWRNLVNTMEHFDALNFVFFGINDVQCTFELAADQVADYCTAGFVGVVKPPTTTMLSGLRSCLFIMVL